MEIFAADQMVFVQIVEGSGHLAKALIGVYHNGFGGLKGSAGIQHPLEGVGVKPKTHPHAVLMIQFGLGDKVAGINEIHGVYVAALLIGAVGSKSHKGLYLMAGLTAQGGYNVLSDGDSAHGRVALSAPAAMEGDQIKIFIVHIQTGAQDFFKIQLLRPFIDRYNAADDGVGVLEGAVAQEDFQPDQPIPQDDCQSLRSSCGFLPGKGGGHSRKGRFIVHELIALIGQLAGVVSSFVSYLQAGVPEITRTPGRILEAEAVHKADLVLFVQEVIRLLPLRSAEQIKSVAVLHPRSIIHVSQIFVLHNAHKIGGVGSVDLKNFLFVANLDCHFHPP